MNELRRLLVVSFFYPPNPAVGGRRAAQLARHLPDFGWQPTVLTAKTHPGTEPHNGTVPVHATRFFTPWAALESSEPLSVRAARGNRIGRGLYTALRHVLPLSSVRLPDATFGWIRYAVEHGLRLLANDKYDAIFSSAGPPSSHRVAARLSRATNIPWIADYRDLWSGNYWEYRIAPFAWLERRVERRVLSRARCITAVTPGLAEYLSQLHGLPTEVVFNGFEPGDYPTARQHDSRFVILYVGSLYSPSQNPEPFFQALAKLDRRSAVDLQQAGFELHTLGTRSPAFQSAAERHGVARWLRHHNPVPYHESLARQTQATALLFLGWDPPSRDVVTAKLFEYLGAGRPILAVGPPGGTASQILRECGAPDLSPDPETIAARLEAWLREHRSSGRLKAEPYSEALSRYTRRAQAGRLASLLDRQESPDR